MTTEKQTLEQQLNEALLKLPIAKNGKTILHGKSTQWQCPQCQYCYASKQKLQQHMKSKTFARGCKKVCYECIECNFKTTDKNDYQRHLCCASHKYKYTLAHGKTVIFKEIQHYLWCKAQITAFQKQRKLLAQHSITCSQYFEQKEIDTLPDDHEKVQIYEDMSQELVNMHVALKDKEPDKYWGTLVIQFFDKWLKADVKGLIHQWKLNKPMKKKRVAKRLKIIRANSPTKRNIKFIIKPKQSM